MGIVDGIETIHGWHKKHENINESVNDCNVMCEWIHEWENWQHVFTIKIVKISQELHNSNIFWVNTVVVGVAEVYVRFETQKLCICIKRQLTWNVCYLYVYNKWIHNETYNKL